jgi:hypothetical protein
MNFDSDYYDNEKRKIMEKNNKKKYNNEYYHTVRKKLQKIEKCRHYAKEYKGEDKTIIKIEEGKFTIEM